MGCKGQPFFAPGRGGLGQRKKYSGVGGAATVKFGAFSVLKIFSRGRGGAEISTPRELNLEFSMRGGML